MTVNSTPINDSCSIRVRQIQDMPLLPRFGWLWDDTKAADVHTLCLLLIERDYDMSECTLLRQVFFNYFRMLGGRQHVALGWGTCVTS